MSFDQKLLVFLKRQLFRAPPVRQDAVGWDLGVVIEFYQLHAGNINEPHVDGVLKQKSTRQTMGDSQKRGIEARAPIEIDFIKSLAMHLIAKSSGFL